MKMTKAQRYDLDKAVLAAIADRRGRATYVLRNTLDWPGKPWHRKGLQTSDVLRSCRRLEKRGTVEQAPTSYAVMKAWTITEAGRRALEGGDG